MNECYSMDIISVLTLILAVIGAVLGLINTIDLLNKNRVRLKVIPARCIPMTGFLENLGPLIAIEVINFSAFPVRISDIGFTLPDKLKVSVFDPIISEGKSLPISLSPHESITFYIKISGIKPQMLKNARKAYARTTSGIMRVGTSPALKQIIDQAGFES
jgi:hypothetical protein